MAGKVLVTCSRIHRVRDGRKEVQLLVGRLGNRFGFLVDDCRKGEAAETTAWYLLEEETDWSPLSLESAGTISQFRKTDDGQQITLFLCRSWRPLKGQSHYKPTNEDLFWISARELWERMTSTGFKKILQCLLNKLACLDSEAAYLVAAILENQETEGRSRKLW